MAKKILVIDDEPHFVEVIASRLRANHLDVVTAVFGREGLEKAKTEKPDLILLDILMTDMDGYQVLRCLKERAETKNVPVIMLTVKKWSDDTKKAIEYGAVDYIVKPFEPSTLMEKIKGALKNG